MVILANPVSWKLQFARVNYLEHCLETENEDRPDRDEGKRWEVNKSGHFGTLDPRVTGVLPIALGRACRLTHWFMGRNKTYVGKMMLHRQVAPDQLERRMQEFVGKIEQRPPVRSRVKRQLRERQVFYWQALDKQGREVSFILEVQAGTYVRKLIADLGKRIGGAHMTELRRTKAGLFSQEDESFTALEVFQRAAGDYQNQDESTLRKMLIPAEVIGLVLPVVEVKEEAVARLAYGSPVLDIAGNLPEQDCDVAVFSSGHFVEVARVVNEVEVIARPRFVFVRS